MKKRYHFKIMTPEEFDQIKSMLRASVPVRTIVKVTKRSWLVTNTINNTNSFDEYKKIIRNTLSKKIKERKVVSENQPKLLPDENETKNMLSDILNNQATILIDLEKIKSRLLIK